ncbi:hypothetical protein [Armatimonas rosea]|uniref:Uncharacterized protein n=1 Tax=Armatimonas rosea TaxID=685828 RepID=A0A7W9SNI0_ARMRO|nr:hypothetical protein [Armatimonas rosea]MBB6049585.1 hypothetical protein [Armatimonas rosea]
MRALKLLPIALTLSLLSVALARAADPPPEPDKILLSIPDAGGLRMVVKTGNKLAVHVAGHDLPEVPLDSIPNVPAFSADSAGYVNGGSETLNREHTLRNLFGTGLGLKIQARTKLTANPSGIVLEKAGTSGSGGVALVLPVKDKDGNPIEVDVAPLTIQRNGAISFTVTSNLPASKLPIKLPGGILLSASSVKVSYSHTPGSDDDDAKMELGDVTVQAPIPGMLTGDNNPVPLTLSVASASVNTDGQVSFKGAQLKTAPAGQAPAQVASTRRLVPAAVARGRRDGIKFPYTISLMKPADFNIVLKSPSAVTLDMENNLPKGFTLTCDIELPQDFTRVPSTPPSADDSKRVTAEEVKFDLSTNGFQAELKKPVTALFKGFKVAITEATLDFSEAGSPAGVPGGPSWEGVFVKKATLTLPETIQQDPSAPVDPSAAPDPSAPKTPGSSVPVTVKVSNAWIDNNGFTGTAEVSGGKLSIEDFPVDLKKLSVKVQRNSLKECTIAASLALNGLGGPPDPSGKAAAAPKLDVDGSVSNTGLASLHVKTGKVYLDSFNAILEIEDGTVLHTPASGTKPAATTLGLSGNWSFTEKAPESVQGVAVQVKGLQIDSQGKFALDSLWIDLPASTKLDIGPVCLEADQIGFGGIGPGTQHAWVGLTGSVELSGDLPVQASADFDGLTIFDNGDINIGRIGIDCDVKNIVHVSGYIEQTDGYITRTVAGRSGGKALNVGDKIPLMLSGNKPLKVVDGQVSISLPILGGDPDSDSGPGGTVEFLVARNCWFVMGSFSSTSPLIPLGQSGLALYGFGGGVGYNITSEVPGAVGIPGRSYQVVPDLAAIDGKPSASGLPNIIALASVRLGTVATPAPVWGDITLVADIGKLTFTLQGDCYLADPMPAEVPASPDKMNRVLSAAISYDGLSNTFQIRGVADLCIPKKDDKDAMGKPYKDASGKVIDKTLMRLHAPFLFKIGKYDPNTDKGFEQDTNSRVFFAKLGGPINLGPETTQNGVTAHRSLSISDPVTLKIRGLEPIQGAISVDLNKGEFLAGLKIHQTFHADSGGAQTYDATIADVHVATIKYQYTLDGEFDALGWLKVGFAGLGSPKPGSPALDDNLNASGEFYLYALLKGKASGIRVDPAWGFAFNVPDIGISAVLEADLTGSATKDKLSIHGQAYADLGFTIKGHTLSLPFAKDIEWTYN